MNPPQSTAPKAPTYPRRAYIVRAAPPNGYSDALSVVACIVLRLDNAGFAVCQVQIGSTTEERFVRIEDLASTHDRALARVHHLLHAIEFRPPHHDVAGTTNPAACDSPPAATPSAGAPQQQQVPAVVHG